MSRREFRIYADSNQEEAIELIGFDIRIGRLAEIDSLISELVPEKEKIKQEIMIEMGEAETAFCGERKFTWKKQAGRSTIDGDALKKECPDVYEKYLKIGSPYRVFRAV